MNIEADLRPYYLDMQHARRRYDHRNETRPIFLPEFLEQFKEATIDAIESCWTEARITDEATTQRLRIPVAKGFVARHIVRNDDSTRSPLYFATPRGQALVKAWREYQQAKAERENSPTGEKG